MNTAHIVVQTIAPVLRDVRALAIQRAPLEEDGQNALIGKSVTLESTPEWAEMIARVRRSGAQTFAGRSLAGIKAIESNSDGQVHGRGDSINVIGCSVATRTTAQK